MRLGIIARAEIDRGLGVQTLALVQNLKPDKVLVIDDWNSGHAGHFQNYPGAQITRLGPDHRLYKWEARAFLKNLDVVLSVETCYSPEFYDWARQAKVVTVVQGNPEFVRPYEKPDAWWWPTSWRMKKLPKGRLVPVPCPDVEITAAPYGEASEALKVLHIAGKKALKDRNGTQPFFASVSHFGVPTKFTVYTQDPLPFTEPQLARHSITVPPSPGDRFEMYRDQHVLVLPRRYGGLCLPALEAMSRGVVVAMADCPPNRDWPIIPIPAGRAPSLEMPGGTIEVWGCEPNAIARSVRSLSKPDRLLRQQEEVLAWAKENTWSKLLPLYLAELERL